MMTEIILSIFIIAGSFLMFIAGLGVLRMPDIFMRMHAATKAPSLGIMLMLVVVMISFPDLITIVKSLLVIIFIYITIPISANMLGKTSLDMGLPMWKKEKKQ
jgi:multicomponent Na+:H+ antiporter subunit G